MLYDRFGGDIGIARELTNAAEGGDLEAQNDLGVRYIQGKEVVKDYEIAVTYFGKAAERGYALAQKKYGADLFDGQGCRSKPRASG